MFVFNIERMDTAEIIKVLNSLPEDKQAEALDYVKFLKYQAAKERIIASDKEALLTFQNVEELMAAIENAD